MTKLSKRMKSLREQVDRSKSYPLTEAVALAKKLATTKFKNGESVDLSVNLGLDAKRDTLRGALLLPHGTGRTVRVAVFAEGDLAKEASDAGADIVGFDDLAEKVKKGEMDFDVVIATPDAMRLVGQLGQILGPRGLMPNPKVGTVTPDVKKAVENAKGGQVRFRTDKAGIIHASIGKVDFTQEQIQGNLEALLADLKKLKPASSKGAYVRNITLSTTMGPGLKIDLSTIQE